MEKYYFLVDCGSYTKKLTYKQYLLYMESHPVHGFKVLKSDYKALENSLKGVILRDKTTFIFNRLHAAGKTAAA